MKSLQGYPPFMLEFATLSAAPALLSNAGSSGLFHEFIRKEYATCALKDTRLFTGKNCSAEKIAPISWGARADGGTQREKGVVKKGTFCSPRLD